VWNLSRSACCRRGRRHGNVAIPAAEPGAQVVAADITPENFEAGRKEADGRGVAVEWVDADAQALPFGDDEFDVVTSSFDAIFAPDRQKVADEMLRVCRSGGTIGMTSFPPDGPGDDIFGVVAPYMPAPPPDALSPLLWGTQNHVRELYGDRVESQQMTERTYTERAPSPQEYVDLFKETFGPVVSVYEALRDERASVRPLSIASSSTSLIWQIEARRTLGPSTRTNIFS
jgi:ubiquinone/menaquinone biosynthesis C-methylase UbiE